MRRTGQRGSSRREFLRAAAGAVAAPWIIPASARGADGTTAPSERITLGSIGVGMMGRGHFHMFCQDPAVQVLAACDVDRWRRENAQASADAAYAAARTSGTYRGCAAYTDLRELLARSDIDAVVIATGDRWHAAATVMAAEAGKDIYCEKPISLTIAEARAMVEAVRRYGRVFQAGLQQRTTREFQLACRLVQEGALGKMQIVYIMFAGTNSDVDLPAEPVPDGLDWDLWLGPAPWRPFNGQFHKYGQPERVVPWDFCRDFGGGNLTSNAVHAFDVVQWGLGMDAAGPVEITPPGVNSCADLTYKYPGDITLQVVERRLDSARNMIPKGWDEITTVQPFGAVFVGERGWIHVGREGFLVSYPGDIVRNLPGRDVPASSVFAHHVDWLDAIRTRRRTACDVAIAAQSTIVAHLGGIASWTGRTLRWDPAREEFPGDDEANRMRRRAMREPWRV